MNSATKTSRLQENLAWLYNQLLRPAEFDLEGKKQIFVVPVGPLTYIPFAALIRRRHPVRYAVENFVFGYLPSMYLFDLVLRHAPSRIHDALVMGDPDGDLKWARQEAQSVHKILGGNIGLRVGRNASADVFQRYGPHAGILHLAMHGKLDPQKPERSYLKFADEKFRVIDAVLLDLNHTDMVVLSACETGRGTEGMEYATLARAFAHSGVASIIATLWSVKDAASKLLMEAFYKDIRKGHDRFTALAHAQRIMLSSPNQEYRGPNAWAGYIAFGKP